MITAEQFAEWKEQPVTKEIFGLLKESKKDLQDRLGEGSTLCQTADATHGETSKVVGHIIGLNQLLNITYEQDDVADEVSEVTGH